MASPSRLAALFCVIPALAAPAGAAPAPRAPTAPWVLDFAPTQCLASRTYGTPEHSLTLVLKPSPRGELYELIVLQKTSGSRYAREAPVEVRIGDAPPFATKLLIYKAKDSPRQARMALPAATVQALRGARTLSIKAKGDVDLVFALSGTGPLMAQMDRCLASLQEYWNISEARGAALRSLPQGSLQGVFDSDDYPGDAWSRNATGVVEVQMLIDEAGKVADCTLTATSGNALLDAQSCAVIRERAKYAPAVGADGKPARHATVGRISWQLPGQRPSRSRTD